MFGVASAVKQTALRADAPDGRIAAVGRATRPRARPSRSSGSTRACAGLSETSTVTEPAGARLPANVALALPLSPAATCPLDRVGAGLNGGHAPHEAPRLAGGQAPERPGVGVGGVAAARGGVDDPHRARRVGEAGLLGARGERVDGHRDVGHGLVARVAHGDHEALGLGQVLLGREARSDDVDLEGSRGLGGVLALAAAAARDRERRRRRRRTRRNGTRTRSTPPRRPERTTGVRAPMPLTERDGSGLSAVPRFA